MIYGGAYACCGRAGTVRHIPLPAYVPSLLLVWGEPAPRQVSKLTMNCRPCYGREASGAIPESFRPEAAVASVVVLRGKFRAYVLASTPFCLSIFRSF